LLGLLEMVKYVLKIRHVLERETEYFPEVTKMSQNVSRVCVSV
jgi:hypothetical protein